METIAAVIAISLGSWEAKIVMAAVAVDMGTGVASALRRGDFQWARLGDVVGHNILPFVMVYSVVLLAAKLDPSWAPFRVALVGVILAALMGSIRDNLKELGLDIPLPAQKPMANNK